ncbi:MAG: hypothetical protein ACO1SV_08020 [Fimbriimonas sp.]
MTDNPGNFDDAVKGVLTDALSDAEPGEQASGQTEGQINNPHTSSSTPYEHVDSTEATKQSDGSVTFDKGHSKPD